MNMKIFSPAKINCHLRVTGRRADGYHLLRMVMVPLDFGDDLDIVLDATAPPDGWQTWTRDDITVQSAPSAVALDQTHLCYRAALAMCEAVGGEGPVTIRLAKRIPVGGGLGGGSSNAAAVLHGLNRLWHLGWDAAQLARVGVQLGADVPFFCWGKPAVVGGIGEEVMPCGQFPNLPILLVNPVVHIATADIFRRIDFQLTPTRPDASFPPLFERFEDVTAILQNDLEMVTVPLYPVIAEIKQRLTVAGGAALMSGSGSTVFGVFRTAAARDAAYRSLQGSGWWLQTAAIISTSG